MLIVKGGISRNIEEKDLQEYLDKGYSAAEVEEKDEKKKPKQEKKE